MGDRGCAGGGGGGDGGGGGSGPPDVADLWPEAAADRRLVTWAHAVNSRALLRQALDGEVMMLEADVSLGGERGPGGLLLQEAVPIMAHPPANESDLSLAAFLDAVIAAGGRRGIKLDFKSVSVWEASVSLLARADPLLRLPVWLNADVAAGPGGQAPVDARRFLSLCRDRFPGRTLSLGWTTGPPAPGDAYTLGQVSEMQQALAAAAVPPDTPVTFAVRAALAARSAPVLLPLLERPGASLTLWGAADDQVDEAGLLALAEAAGPHRLYVDLPAPPPGLLPQPQTPGAGAAPAPARPLLAAALAATSLLTLARPDC